MSHSMKPFLHMLLVFVVGIKCAASQSIVETLPGYDGTLPFKLETGSLHFSLHYILSPLASDFKNFDGSLPSFVLNPYSWTKVANIIFLDYPVRTGFSYSNNARSFPVSDTNSTQHNYTFLRKWLLAHPVFIKNRLYVSGDSYGGKIAPMLALAIAKGNEAGLEPIMSLKGYIVGNPVTDAKQDKNERVPYAHRMGLISDKQFKQARSSCNGEYMNPDPNNAHCLSALNIIDECTTPLNWLHILEPLCTTILQKPSDSRRFQPSLVDHGPVDLTSLSDQNELKCRDDNYLTSYVWANDDTVRESLNIRKGTITDWERCNNSLSYSYDVESAVEHHQNLSDLGFQALVYSGDHDMSTSYMATLKWIRKLNVSVNDEWRAWTVDGQVAGYTELYKSKTKEAYLMFATVKGAGHTAPEYKPRECFEMIRRWLSLYPLVQIVTPFVRVGTYSTRNFATGASFVSSLVIRSRRWVALIAANVHRSRLLAAALTATFWLAPPVQSHSLIQTLPGFPGKLPFKLETGYVGVGGSQEIQLFYYFIESQRSPTNDPLFLWLTGGPACSGLSALLYEIGPIHIDYANSNGTIPALVLNPYSWTKVANIIFIDQPVGTGFSYAKTQQAYKSSDTVSATLTYDFLKRWLINHPQYSKNPLYIGGGSYAGIIVPLVVDQVYNGIEAGSEPPMNLKGYVLGNPFTDINGTSGEMNGRVAFAYRMGLLSDELYMSARENCNGNYLNVHPDNYLCMEDLERVTECLEKIYTFQILEPVCDVGSDKRGLLLDHMPMRDEIARRLLTASPLGVEPWCRDNNMLYSIKWANNEIVQRALHIREGTKIEWVRCNATLKGDYTYDVKSTFDYHRKFSYKKCRALIFSGDHDMIAPHTVTEKWIAALKLQIRSKWRPWFVEGQITGYTATYSHSEHELTYATVKGAGHTPAEYKPLQCLPMIQRWVDHSPL
ncbi:sinapoylglucose--choline O-sinapoyltransferase [Salvia divinorum]|uniref:Sinapoylglucose--choline O-sinapoyltransferase n=1 Tax=Salvia divinorum TaxID=28513 RepID=A0ABD1FRL4_SALDI